MVRNTYYDTSSGTYKIFCDNIDMLRDNYNPLICFFRTHKYVYYYKSSYYDHNNDSATKYTLH